MISTSTPELLKTGKDYYDKGDLKKAQSVYSDIVDVDQDCTEAFFNLANIFHLKGEIGKAIKAFNKVLELEPNHTDASISLSVLYNDIGRYDEAQKIFEKANERVKNKTSQNEGVEDQHINKKFSQKHFEIAELYMSYGRYDEALFEYNKASQLDYENHEIRVRVAKTYAKKGFIAKAQEELKTLKNENPEYLPARIALGVLYYGQGKILEAQAQWQRVLVKDPSHSEAAMYLNLSKTATETRLN
jgi:tetratricopeptide (TPR) repeat protein